MKSNISKRYTAVIIVIAAVSGCSHGICQLCSSCEKTLEDSYKERIPWLPNEVAPIANDRFIQNIEHNRKDD